MFGHSDLFGSSEGPIRDNGRSSLGYSDKLTRFNWIDVSDSDLRQGFREASKGNSPVHVLSVVEGFLSHHVSEREQSPARDSENRECSRDLDSFGEGPCVGFSTYLFELQVSRESSIDDGASLLGINRRGFLAGVGAGPDADNAVFPFDGCGLYYRSASLHCAERRF